MSRTTYLKALPNPEVKYGDWVIGIPEGQLLPIPGDTCGGRENFPGRPDHAVQTVLTLVKARTGQNLRVLSKPELCSQPGLSDFFKDTPHTYMVEGKTDLLVETQQLLRSMGLKLVLVRD